MKARVRYAKRGPSCRSEENVSSFRIVRIAQQLSPVHSVIECGLLIRKYRLINSIEVIAGCLFFQSMIYDLCGWREVRDIKGQ